MKKDKKGLIIVGFILCFCLGIGTGFLLWHKEEKQNKQNPTKEEKTTTVTSYVDMEKAKEIANLVFHVDKESLTVNDLSDSDKVNIAMSLAGAPFYEHTGTELTEIFQKYFGVDQKLNFVDIKCGFDHGNEEENSMYKFDVEQDKYVYNEKHPGHGGALNNAIQFYMDVEKITDSEDTYEYATKVLYYGPVSFSDVASSNDKYGNGYKSYQDAIDQKNEVVKIDGNSKYWEEHGIEGPPTPKLEQIFTDYRDQLTTYVFKFKKINNSLVFVSYEKK